MMSSLESLIASHAELLSEWRKAYELDLLRHNQAMEWQVGQESEAYTVTIEGTKTFNAFCGPDRGIDIICEHFQLEREGIRKKRTEEELDEATEAAIDRMSATQKVLQTVPEYIAYRKASDIENVFYWELMDVERQILEYPVIEKADVIAKAQFMTERDWCDTENWPENTGVFEQLLKSFDILTPPIDGCAKRSPA